MQRHSIKLSFNGDAERLAREATGRAGFDISAGDAALFMLQESESLAKDVGKRVKWGVWDKETPINGVDSEVILGRPDYNGGEIYLIWIDEELIFLQPHVPEDDAPVYADEVEEVAEIHAISVAEDMLYSELSENLAGSIDPPVINNDIVDQLQILIENSNQPGAGRRPRRPVR